MAQVPTKMEVELCATKYALEDFLQNNDEHFSRLFEDLYSTLEKDLTNEEVRESFFISVFGLIISEDNRLCELIKKLKVQPSAYDTRLIPYTLSWLIWNNSTKRKRGLVK